MLLAERKSDIEAYAPESDPDVATEVDNIFRLALSVSGRRRPARHELVKPNPDFEASLELLTRAATTLEALQERCAMLEANLAAEAERRRSEVNAAYQLAKEWERRATTVKAQLCDCESRVSDLQAQVETAINRGEHAEDRLVLAEQEASRAMSQTRLFHDKIISAFGPSSI